MPSIPQMERVYVQKNTCDRLRLIAREGEDLQEVVNRVLFERVLNDGRFNPTEENRECPRRS